MNHNNCGVGKKTVFRFTKFDQLWPEAYKIKYGCHCTQCSGIKQHFGMHKELKVYKYVYRNNMYHTVDKCVVSYKQNLVISIVWMNETTTNIHKTITNHMHVILKHASFVDQSLWLNNKAVQCE